MRGLLRNIVVAGGLAHTTLADLVDYSTGSGPTYSVGVPSGSSISGSNAGAIYFQLEAPDTFSWVGLGIGQQMKGASIFVMYADGTGNVTISARDGGRGEVEPTADSTLAAGVELLAGSGVSGGVMTANVRCTTCVLAASDLSSSPFITAWKTGSALNSKSQSASISQHAGNGYQVISFDLSKASLSSDTNPFVAAASPAASSSSSASGTASGTSSGTSPTSSSSSGSSGSDSGSSSGSGSGGVVVVGGKSDAAKTIITYQKAHGIIMGLTVVLLFPLGAVFMRLGGSALMHGALQLVALSLLIAGFALGVKLADIRQLLFENQGRTHTIFGTVIFALFLLQPVGGIIHHLQYRKIQSRTAISHGHIWFGRSVMILAVINGGLGLQISANTKGGEIAYGVIAGVVAVAYAAITIFKRKGVETKWDGGREKVASREVSRDERGEAGSEARGASRSPS